MSTPENETEAAAPPPEETPAPTPAYTGVEDVVPPASEVKPEEEETAVPSEPVPEEEPAEAVTPPEEVEEPVANDTHPTSQDEEMKDAVERPQEESAEPTETVEDTPAAELKADSSESGLIKEQDEAEESKERGSLYDTNTRASESKSEGEQAAEDSATSKELPYSTRGRSTDRDASSGEEKFSAVEALEEIGRVKDSSPAALGVSFLESLSEEERRTRTRFVPDVEGMHVLRKHEIRDDLSLARSLISSSGITSLKKSKSKRADAMDVDEEDGISPSEDGSMDAARPGTKLLELPTRDLVVPSNAFVAPPVAAGDDEGQTTSIAALKTENGVKSPLLVESVTAFNPPRPPESIGAKKKHRMLRWERRPEDVEVDLNNYRKTVQRTRQELHKAEAEYNRLETIDAHLRWNFSNHLNLMNEEYVRLNEEVGTVQQECVKAADLLTSRTRSRGAGKGSIIMRDVLGVLKAKGSEKAEPTETPQYPIIENPLAYPGIGGLAPSVFSDWNRKSTIAQKEPASAWTVPGEKVKTPYGEGVVVEVFASEPVTEPKEKEADDDKQKGGNSGKKEGGKSASRKKGASKKEAEKPEEKVKKDYLCNYLPPRVSVKLPFGIGYFPCYSIEPLENPCLFSDAKLSARWKNMVDTALLVGSTIDLEGMNFNSRDRPRESEGAEGEGSKMDVEGAAGQADAQNSEEVAVKTDETDEECFMPFGAGLLPTKTGRGNLLQNLSITDIEKAMDNALYHGAGVLGEKSNQGVTEEFRKWEDDEQEFLTLQASVLQFRNALVRQKRIRLLNEKTNSATADRYIRSAELVAEMRSDLKSLKHRLEEELNELGLDETATEQILSNYYLGQESPVDIGEASPLKRSRRGIGPMEDAGTTPSYGDDDRESVDDQDLSGDDEVRPAKKLRPNQ